MAQFLLICQWTPSAREYLIQYPTVCGETIFDHLLRSFLLCCASWLRPENPYYLWVRVVVAHTINYAAWWKELAYRLSVPFPQWGSCLPMTHRSSAWWDIQDIQLRIWLSLTLTWCWLLALGWMYARRVLRRTPGQKTRKL